MTALFGSMGNNSMTTENMLLPPNGESLQLDAWKFMQVSVHTDYFHKAELTVDLMSNW